MRVRSKQECGHRDSCNRVHRTVAAEGLCLTGLDVHYSSGHLDSVDDLPMKNVRVIDTLNCTQAVHISC